MHAPFAEGGGKAMFALSVAATTHPRSPRGAIGKVLEAVMPPPAAAPLDGSVIRGTCFVHSVLLAGLR